MAGSGKELLQPISPTVSVRTRRFPCSFTSRRVSVFRKIPKHQLLWLGRELGLPHSALIFKSEKRLVHQAKTGSFLASSGRGSISFITTNLQLCKLTVS